MTKIELEMTLSGSDPVAIVHACRALDLAPTGKPERVLIDDRRVKVASSEDFLVSSVARAKRKAAALYPGHPHVISIYKGELVYIGLPEVDVEPRGFAEKLSTVPFEIASFGSIHPEWTDRDAGPEYNAPSFSDYHGPHGWGCAFAGRGYGRLVSRRWLDFGPWRTLHVSNDVTLVQFHDLDADAATALAQARVGHARMGISDEGGFLQTGFFFSLKLGGLYSPEERKMKVVVHGRELAQRELLEWCAARRSQAFGPEQPFDSVAFVFPEEAAARRNLHELWLRELECWTIRDGEEVRLDAEYAPKPSPPEWVKRLDG